MWSATGPCGVNWTPFSYVTFGNRLVGAACAGAASDERGDEGGQPGGEQEASHGPNEASEIQTGDLQVLQDSNSRALQSGTADCGLP